MINGTTSGDHLAIAAVSIRREREREGETERERVREAVMKNPVTVRHWSR